MDKLKERLTNELQQEEHVRILDTMSWSLPVHTIGIAYKTVKRSKMDILMKMMLITFQKAEIESAKELSEMLVVEPLFINDLINKMIRGRLIQKKSSSFELTDAGIQQLDNEVFEHEPIDGSKEALYSPCHERFLDGEIKEMRLENPDIYRLLNEFDDFKVTSVEENELLNVLNLLGVESDEGHIQIVISEILSTVELKSHLIPCQEFRLHNETEDTIYARVWNTLTEEWDATLEAQLNEKERIQWRKMYLQNA